MQGAKGKVVHIGDGRIYIFRNGRLEQLTKDQTLVAELVGGHLTLEAVPRFPLRNVLARAVGPQESVEPDIADLELTLHDWPPAGHRRAGQGSGHRAVALPR